MKTRNYTPEIKERAVRMLIEATSDYPSTWSAIQAIAPKIGCTPETLRAWHKKHVDQTIPTNIQAQDQACHYVESIVGKNVALQSQPIAIKAFIEWHDRVCQVDKDLPLA